MVDRLRIEMAACAQILPMAGLATLAIHLRHNAVTAQAPRLIMRYRLLRLVAREAALLGVARFTGCRRNNGRGAVITLPASAMIGRLAAWFKIPVAGVARQRNLSLRAMTGVQAGGHGRNLLPTVHDRVTVVARNAIVFRVIEIQTKRALPFPVRLKDRLGLRRCDMLHGLLVAGLAGLDCRHHAALRGVTVRTGRTELDVLLVRKYRKLAVIA